MLRKYRQIWNLTKSLIRFIYKGNWNQSEQYIFISMSSIQYFLELVRERVFFST